MRIRDLFHACGNISFDTNFRVYRDSRLDGIGYNGQYGEMPEDVKEWKIICFEFDNDFNGILIYASNRN